ncbi:Isochorismate synthase @ Menaquinone-specific isochorismate synthase [hydrothermal vent metagenome]|uniref:isochorismate synthase n=1 Tax=hydrothermal vent metagenome TaxID=652676 RepID=A0A3B0VHD6_9ZZZZ
MKDNNKMNGRLISVSIPAPGVETAVFLQQAIGQERFYWHDANGGVALAGFGVAADLFAWGNGRFQQIQQQARQLFTNAIIHDNQNKLAGPRLFGGFAFIDNFIPDNTWSIHYPAQFILPHYQLSQQGEQSWLTLNAILPHNESPKAILPELQTALTTRLTLLKKPPRPPLTQAIADCPPPHPSNRKLPTPSPLHLNYPMPYPNWQTMINHATHTMQTSDLNKVVLSRVCEIRYRQKVDVDGTLAYLDDHYPDCYRFLFEPRPFHAFFGATPELLVQVNGRSLQTMGLAGSIARGKTPAEDETLAQELLNSAKNQHEHALVVESIRRRLEPLAAKLDIPSQPSILQLGYIQHLHTPIQASLHRADGILPILKNLHPTPALGGQPRHLAMPFISQAEPVPRGWYGAPVGWLNHNLDGAFGVAIRSAISQDRRVWLYSGAGIVADSDPQAEWEETKLKFRPMLNALQIVNGKL